ncbi:hypothetical protein T265_00909 [Opisthorchis viverrini]|uniref:Uncharacterized protein n=1 Tax=Opisthorchis viverrini TaxID=6198 RepID=A0A075A4N5_OPIVI|nr:hypothetical protein T265_00909 [Opisthorchis viverrini]KER33222.1 hypothetical protein T265_00909 [Opisthorchis viverrini]
MPGGIDVNNWAPPSSISDHGPLGPTRQWEFRTQAEVSTHTCCEFLVFELGQPGSIPALVPPSFGMAIRRRKGAAAERSIDRY